MPYMQLKIAMMKTDLNILYEDNHLLVVVKGENILSQADSTADLDMLSILKEYLKEKYQKPGVAYLGLVHRLDRRVSGVMVFAKTSKAAARLSKQIRDLVFKKHYYAIVLGTIENSDVYEDKLVKEKVDKQYKARISKNGKLAKLSYELKNSVLIDEQRYNLIDVNLITGRYNQIRVQFAFRGYPLLNDLKYGFDKTTNFSDFGLICYKLEFYHPISNELLKFEYVPSSGIWEKLK